MNSKEYEIFIKEVVQELLTSDSVEVHHLREYVGKISGRKIKIDVSFETYVLGAKILVLVECKYYKNKIDVGEVEEFYSKLNDIGAHKGIMVTTIGFQEGAISVAKGREIALATLGTYASEKGFVYVTKAYDPDKQNEESKIFKGNIIVGGRFSDEKDNIGFRFKTLDKMLDIIRISLFTHPEIVKHTKNLW